MEHAEALRPLVPPGMNCREMALRFILNNPTVSTIIPGMRKVKNVEGNIRAGEQGTVAGGSAHGIAQASLGPEALQVVAVEVTHVGQALKVRLGIVNDPAESRRFPHGEENRNHAPGISEGHGLLGAGAAVLGGLAPARVLGANDRIRVRRAGKRASRALRHENVQEGS